MHLSSVSASLLLVGGAVALRARAVEGDEVSAPAPKSYIIEYSSSSLRKRQAEISSDPDIEVVRTFDSDIFHGVSVNTNAYNSDTLNALPDVVKVWLNEEVPLAPIDIHGYSDDASAYNYTTHITTGVSKLHEQGIFGKGVKIGVVDTGIYYPHEALGGGLGEGFKVAGGYDFVGDGNWPFEAAAPDDDPIDYRGHGTHVAGIIGGQTEFWQGVAPEAELFAYKVFTNNPSTSTDILIAAFIRAYEDGCDIITSSIGGSNGWSHNPWAEVASRLVERGIVVTISAGNSGANGPFYGSSGSSGKNVLAIASVETQDFPASPFEANFKLDGQSNVTTIGYLPSNFYFPASIKDWPIVPLNLNVNIADDACTPFPAGTPRLDRAVALVRRGSCTFAIKQANLEALGAQYILIYNNASPLVVPSTDRFTSAIGAITADAGAAIIKTIIDGGSVTADFTRNPEEVVGIEHAVGGKPSIFTSWAGLYDLQQKPDIAAPGGNIFSAWSDGGYSTISGTSMACPYVAGVAALWISAHGGRETHGNDFALKLHQRIISSGVSVPWYDGTLTNFGYPAPPAQVGNGLLNAWKIVNYNATRLEFNKIALNDTRYFNRYHDITIINEGTEDVSYTWSVEHGGGLEAIGRFPNASGQQVKRIKLFSQLRPLTLEARVTLPKSFKLKAGEKKTVSVNFDNPDKLGWTAANLPVYGGKVFLSSSVGEQLSVPFFGVGADLRRELTPLSEAGFPVSVSGTGNVPITQDSSYSFDLSVSAQDFPKILSKLLWGSREVRWDVYQSGWTERKWQYPPVIGQNGYVGTVAAWAGGNSVAVFDPDLYDPDETFSFPIQDTFRNVAETTRYYWFGKLGNGTQIANGKYVVRFAALKPFGNAKASDAWEVYGPHEIEVTGKY